MGVVGGGCGRWWVWSVQRPSYTCVIYIHLKTPSVCTPGSKFVKYQSFPHHFHWILESFDTFHPSGFYQPNVASSTLIPVGSPLYPNLRVRGHNRGIPGLGRCSEVRRLGPRAPGVFLCSRQKQTNANWQPRLTWLSNECT